MTGLNYGDSQTSPLEPFRGADDFLRSTICTEIGEETYRPALDKCKTELALSGKKDPEKNPMVVREIIATAATRARCSQTLQSIVQNIRLLRASSMLSTEETS